MTTFKLELATVLLVFFVPAARRLDTEKLPKIIPIGKFADDSNVAVGPGVLVIKMTTIIEKNVMNN